MQKKAISFQFLIIAALPSMTRAAPLLINQYDQSGDGPNGTAMGDSNISVTASSYIRSDFEPQTTIAGITTSGGFSDSSPADGSFSDGKFVDADDNGIPEHDANLYEWISDGNDIDGEWLSYDLGNKYNLWQMTVWNCNRFPTRGMKDIKVFVSSLASPALPAGRETNPGNHDDWTEIGNGFTLSQASGNDDYGNATLEPDNVPDTIDLGDVSAQHVLIDVESNHGYGPGDTGNPSVGITEVQFFTPEPSSLALLTLALTTLLGRRPRRRK